MDISTRKQASVQVVRLKGALRLGQAVDDFKETLQGLADEGETSVVLNLTEVPMIDSSGIGMLIRFQAQAKGRGGEVKLVSPGKFVLHTMQLMSIENLFDIHQDENEAIAAFGDD